MSGAKGKSEKKRIAEFTKNLLSVTPAQAGVQKQMKRRDPRVRVDGETDHILTLFTSSSK